MDRTPMLQGLVAAIIVAGLTIAVPGAYRVPLLAGLLWMTVGMYLGMALMHGPRHVRVEFLAGLPVLACAMLALWSPWFLAVGWLAHPVWDLLHQWGVVKTHIHPSTVGFCIVFDVIVAGLAATVALGLL